MVFFYFQQSIHQFVFQFHQFLFPQNLFFYLRLFLLYFLFQLVFLLYSKHFSFGIYSLQQYKNRVIAYSLGNFCFGGNSNPRDKRSFIFQSNLKFTNNNLTAIGVRVIPCSISSVDYKNDYCPTPLEGDAKINLLSTLNKLSENSGFKISDEFFYIDVNNNN